MRPVRIADVSNARSSYEEQLGGDEGPTFESLIEDGWIRIVRGRINIPVEFLRAYKEEHPSHARAFEWLQTHQYDIRYTFDLSVDPPGAEVVNALNAQTVDLNELRCARPEWVAVRRWEQLCAEQSEPEAALQLWLDGWKILGWPRFVPIREWNRFALERFHGAVQKILAPEPTPPWADIYERAAVEMAHAQNATVDIARSHVLPVPTTLVERYEWLSARGNDRVFLSRMWPLIEISALMELVLNDIEATEDSAAPHPLWKGLFPLIERSPDLLFILGLQSSAYPNLMADMLLSSESVTLGCLLLAQWKLAGDAHAGNELRQLRERRKEEAFRDGCEVLRYFVDEGDLPAAEVAALIKLLFSRELAATGSSEESQGRMRLALVESLSRVAREELKAIVSWTNQSELGGPGDVLFMGLTSLVSASGDVSGIEGKPIVDAYVQALRQGEFRLSARGVTKEQAATVYELALQSDKAALNSFLQPLNMESRLGVVRTEPGSLAAFQAVEDANRSIRVHVRVLCRVISSNRIALSDALLEGLISVLKKGAINRHERYQVDAFAASFDADTVGKDTDRPISADLGEALATLNGEQQQRLFKAILEIEEPGTLAQLLSYVPQALRSQIRSRVRELTPESSSDLNMLTAQQVRIDHLLNAGLADVASLFVTAERNLETLGNVPGRSMQRLRFQLRLLLLTENWDALESMPVPEDDAEFDKAAARDTIEFFRGLSMLRRGGSNLGKAVEIFDALYRRHRNVPAYLVNLQATKIASLLGADIFGYLKADQAAEAHEIITDGLDSIASNRGFTENDRTTVLLNLALLSLSLRQPKQTLDLLAKVDSEVLPDSFYAYKALALHRQGEVMIAQGMLAEAENRHGRTPVVEAAASQISYGTPFSGKVSSVFDEDPVIWIRKAHGHLHLLSAVDQARVFSAGDSTIGQFLLRHLYETSAGVINLVPMMRKLGLSTLEDDVTAVFKEILNARLRIVKWALGDQSKGGVTAGGNPGERDLVIANDTATLTIFEAVMVREPVSWKKVQDDLTNHFVKLFSYGACPAYFYVTYVMTHEVVNVVEQLKVIARDKASDGFTFVNLDVLPFVDSGPSGFTATYKSAKGDRQVHFLILDLSMEVEKKAAKQADSYRPKKKTDLAGTKEGNDTERT